MQNNREILNARAVFRPMRPTATVSFLLTASLTLGAITGCNKASEQKSVVKEVLKSSLEQTLSLQILNQLPESAAGFIVSDLSTPQFKKYAESLGKNSESAISKLLDKALSVGKENGLSLPESIKQITESFGITGDPSKPRVFGQLLAYVVPPKDDKIENIGAALIASSANGIDLKSKLPEVQQLFKELGYQITEIDGAVGTASGFTASNKADLATFYCGVSSDKIGIALSEELLKSAFTETPNSGIKILSEAPEFKRLATSLTAEDPQLGFGYLSIAKITPLLKSLEKSAKDSGADGEITIENNPVESIGFSAAIGDKFSQVIAASLSAKTDTQKKNFSSLESSNTPKSKLPSDIAFSVSADLGSILKTSPLSDSAGADLAALGLSTEQSNSLLKTNGLTLAIRNNDAGSPFPDMFLILSSAAPKELLETLKSTLTQVSPLAASWQDKKIADYDSSFISTPLGVGIYLAKTESSVVIGSSERTLKDLLQPDGATQITSQPTAGVLSYSINFKQLADLIDSVKGNLSMFMGGQSELDKQLDTKELRLMSNQSGVLSFNSGVASFKAQQAVTQAVNN